MKVFHLSSDSRIGGCEQLLIAIQARHLDDGVEHVFCTVFDRGPLHRAIEALGGAAYSLGVRSGWQLGAAIPRLLSLLRVQRPDILHTHLYHAGVLAWISSAFGWTPLRVHTRHYDTCLHKFGAWWDPLIDRSATRAADSVVAISNAVKDVLVNLEGVPPGRVRVIHNGSDVPDILHDPRPRGGAADLIAVGSLHPWKGHDYLIRAMALVRQAIPGVHLRILGEGSERPVLERLVEQLELGGVVELPGFVGDVLGALASSDLMVQPSLEEGFGISILEAMSQQLATVASRVGGIPEIVEDQVTGLLVPPGDEEALASAIVGLLNDPSRRRAMGLAGRRRLEQHFTLDAMIRGYTDLYRELCSSTSNRGRRDRILSRPVSLEKTEAASDA